MIEIKQVKGLESALATQSGFNFESVTVANGADFVHNLGSLKLDVRFFENGTRVRNDIDWEPVDMTRIKVYLPFGITEFTGEIYIVKRS